MIAIIKGSELVGTSTTRFYLCVNIHTFTFELGLRYCRDLKLETEDVFQI